MTTSAATEASLDLTPIPRHLPGRNPDFPSLSSLFLAHFNYWSDHGMSRNSEMTSRMQAVVADMEQVLEDEPFPKFIISSQHVESITA